MRGDGQRVPSCGYRAPGPNLARCWERLAAGQDRRAVRREGTYVRRPASGTAGAAISVRMGRAAGGFATPVVSKLSADWKSQAFPGKASLPGALFDHTSDLITRRQQ